MYYVCIYIYIYMYSSWACETRRIAPSGKRICLVRTVRGTFGAVLYMIVEYVV